MGGVAHVISPGKVERVTMKIRKTHVVSEADRARAEHTVGGGPLGTFGESAGKIEYSPEPHCPSPSSKTSSGESIVSSRLAGGIELPP